MADVTLHKIDPGTGHSYHTSFMDNYLKLEKYKLFISWLKDEIASKKAFQLMHRISSLVKLLHLNEIVLK